MDQSAEELANCFSSQGRSLMCRLSLNVELPPGGKIIKENLKAETCFVA